MIRLELVETIRIEANSDLSIIIRETPKGPRIEILRDGGEDFAVQVSE